MEIGQVHHIEYYVKDVALTRAFWEPLLAELFYEKFSEWSEGFSWGHKNGTYIVFVSLQPQYLNYANNRQASGLNHIAFQGGDEEFLDKIMGLVQGLGAKILKRKKGYLCFEELNFFAVEIYAS